jgi:hypothetical protein
MPKGKKLGDWNWATMPGPGDLWKPPEDPPHYECERCGKEVYYNPKDYEDADEDGLFPLPLPELCPECEEEE